MIPSCERRVMPNKTNVYGACHRCIEIIRVVDYIASTGGQITEDEIRASNAGIELPR